ncbi:DUF6261 family protein [Plebeiibacterium marinum]|uniref:DUF6261 family protein n=1 Tax=Plebeiibacterium marinum TaxID=2992111 RepID=A0AAE3MDE9_9BACT|nr:DUF6261 family protein [Plebeiobacterium marinum]MCW3805581.1 DUF6261 family protein [Plebeiobacterium marinum]
MMTNMNYSIIDNGTMFSFCKHALSLFGNEENITPTLLPFYNKVKKQHEVMQNAFEREFIDPFTKKKAKANSNRNQSFHAFRHFIKACCMSINETVRASGEKLMLVINKHAKYISKLGYKKQSSAEISVIYEIRKDCMPELETCSATVWFEEMESQQEIFETVMQESLIYELHEKPKLVDTRKELDKNLRSLFTLVDLLSQSTPSDELTQLNQNLNQLVSETMITARSVDTRKRNQLKNDIENDVGEES